MREKKCEKEKNEIKQVRILVLVKILNMLTQQYRNSIYEPFSGKIGEGMFPHC